MGEYIYRFVDVFVFTNVNCFKSFLDENYVYICFSYILNIIVVLVGYTGVAPDFFIKILYSLMKVKYIKFFGCKCKWKDSTDKFISANLT